MLDGHVIYGEIVIDQPNSVIYLGKIAIYLELITEIEKTMVIPRVVQSPNPINPITPPQPQIAANNQHNRQQFGLKCLHCGKVSSTDYAKSYCPWCGTSLAAAQSVIIH
jgi:hypothetical protein